MLFQSRIKDQKNKLNQLGISKIDRLRSMINKVKFVAKNVIYVKNWSDKDENILYKSKASKSNVKYPRYFDINFSNFSIRVINDSHPLMEKVKLLRQKVF